MNRIFYIAILIWQMIACNARFKTMPLKASANNRLYIGQMNGVENLIVDKQNQLYVSGLDGNVYKIDRGKLVQKKKLGKMALGIAADSQYLYLAIANEQQQRRLLRIKKDFSDLQYMTGAIAGLNGICLDKKGQLYYTSSNESLWLPSGKIYRINVRQPESWQKPQVIVDQAKMANGLALSKDDQTLYYTATTSGVYRFNLQSKQKEELYKTGFLGVLDDLYVDEQGVIWVCYNSKEGILKINGHQMTLYKHPQLIAPSAIQPVDKKKMSGPRFYVTEFGRAGQSFTMDGRGVYLFTPHIE